jgi:hypothetical protein
MSREASADTESAPDQVIVGYLFGDPSQVDLDFLREEHAEGRLDALGEVVAQYARLHRPTPALSPSTRSPRS